MAAKRAGRLVVVSLPPTSAIPPAMQVLSFANDRTCSSQAGGAFTFVTSMAGWWIFFAIMLASLDFPFSIPVGDLSHIIKGASEKQKVKDAV